MRANGELLVTGGTMLGPDGSLEQNDLLIVDGTFCEIGQIRPTSDTEICDATGCLVMPGLINAHAHSGENFNPGQFENLPLDLWFVHSHEVTRTVPPDENTIYLRTLLGAIQMLRSGTTTVVDFLYEAPFITTETLGAVVRAYETIGMRATIVLGIADKHYLDSLPLDDSSRGLAKKEAAPLSTDETLELCRAAIERWHDPDGPIQIGLGPSAPQRCTPELLAASKKLANDLGVVWHTHVLETRTQAYTGMTWHNKSLLHVMNEQGLLGPATTVIHSVWLSDDDIRLLHDTGTSAVHCLLSNLRLGDGVARVPALKRGGVNVALGTDGRGCVESLDMLELVKMTALVHKVHGDPYEQWPTAAEALTMGTANGSSVAGYADRLGRIEKGAHADLMILDLSEPAFVPKIDLVRQVVYGAPHRPFKAVIVNGRIVVRDGRIGTIDTEAILAEIGNKNLQGAQRRDDPETNQLEAAVRKLWDKAEATDVGVDAYIPG